ncbi:MAG: glycosyltransferase [Patescibacteria group bacterium]
MKFLLIPENNSLSHIAKCITLMELLESIGHEVHLAAGIKHAGFLNRLGITHHVLPDIQETDHGGFPSFKWFSSVETIVDCIRKEVALIDRIRPDRVLGVFRFTLFASAQIAGVPFDSLICGCMMPQSREVLGFTERDEGREHQRVYLESFYRFAGQKLGLAMRKFGLEGIDDIRHTLQGERTFLWDFPEFMPVPPHPRTTHLGPLLSRRWPYDQIDLKNILDTHYPIAVLSFGTCVTDRAIVHRMIHLLLQLRYKVIVAAGGQQEMLDIRPADPRVVLMRFAPLGEILPHASLLVTHGGQMTVFEALQNEVPVFVMPFQPEQAHNGVCLERIGCGSRLIPSTIFTGFSEDYVKVFNRQSDVEIKACINRVLENGETRKNLKRIRDAIDRYQGADILARLLGEK